MTQKLDLITLEVLRNAFPAIANEMAVDLQRTSYNMMIYEVRDFCTAILDTKGQLISQNVGGVSHFVADLGVIIVDAMKRYGAKGFKPGDVIITNHQAVAGQHLNNVVIYTPYFYKGELLFFSMVRAHWIDIGGQSTGFGAGPTVRDPWLEGLQLNQLKIYEAGELNQTLDTVIRDNIRFPEASMGDMRSQMAACKLAARRLDELFDRYGRETILTALEQIFEETEAKCRHVVEKLQDGVYEAEAFWDNDGVNKTEKVRIHAKVTVKGGDMTIDLSGCSGERKSGINSRTFAAAFVAYKSLTQPLETVNEGSFRALKVIIPEGNIMMARYPAPMASWSMIVPTVVDTIISAIAPAMRDTIPAAHHGMLGGTVVFVGRDPRSDRMTVLQSIEGGGWGGRPSEDGEAGTVSACQGDVRNATIEGMELKCPVVVEQRALRTDSGGAGKHRGGLGIDLRVRNLVEGTWHLPASQRTNSPPRGLWGGKPGVIDAYYMKKPNQKDFELMADHRHLSPPEAIASIRTAGGGGWGDPLERDPEKVRWDVIEGFVSADLARADYGVVLTGKDFAIDTAATAQTRERLKKARPAATAAE